MKIKKWSEFLNESVKIDSFKKDFLQKLADKIDDDFTVNVNFQENIIEVSSDTTIDDDKTFSIGDVSRPTIDINIDAVIKFQFEDKNLTRFLEPTVISKTAVNMGLNKPLTIQDCIKVSASTSLNISVVEFEDFSYTDGDIEDFHDIEIPDTLDEFIEEFYGIVDLELFDEIYPRDIRSILDQYEEDNNLLDNDEDEDEDEDDDH
jgi:hypothetical protein